MAYWENNLQEPSISALKKRCETFGVSADYLLGLRGFKMKLVQAISNRITEFITENKTTAYQICKKGGIPTSTLNDILLMKKKKVTTDTVYQICATLGISLADFFDSPLFDEVTD